jgi:hypothetical protein
MLEPAREVADGPSGLAPQHATSLAILSLLTLIGRDLHDREN